MSFVNLLTKGKDWLKGFLSEIPLLKDTIEEEPDKYYEMQKRSELFEVISNHFHKYKNPGDKLIIQCDHDTSMPYSMFLKLNPTNKKELYLILYKDIFENIIYQDRFDELGRMIDKYFAEFYKKL